MKCVCLARTHTNTHTLTLVACHWRHHLWPRCSLWGLITHTAPLLRGLSLTVMWVLLAVVPHRRHPNCYDTHTHTHTHTHADKTHKNKQSKCETSPWVVVNYSRHDSCACQSKGTHSEDKRYGQGSELDSFIISDSCITISLGTRDAKESKDRFKTQWGKKHILKGSIFACRVVWRTYW